LFEFPPVEGRHVMAWFNGGAITWVAGALLLGQSDHAIQLTERFAACFVDTRTAELVEHPVETLVMQRSSALCLAMRMNDHDDLRHGPVLAGKLAAQCAAGQQVDAEPAGTEPSRTDALSKNQP
jgi:hypothetical protein